ncbi:MAG: hypothetical protein AB1898_07290 [Acidobacteriota bacterium]
MNKTFSTVLQAAGLWLGLLSLPALADITHIQDDRMCANLSQGCAGKGPIPQEQGETRTLKVKGQDVNFCTSASASGAGVTVTIVGTKLVADGFTVGTGQINLRIAVGATAAPGQRTITISHGSTSYSFTLRILRNGVVSGLNAVPRQSDYFTQVDVTLTGTNIAQAGTRLELIGTSPPGTTQAQVLSSNDTTAVVRLTFSTPQSKATGRIVLFDNSFPGACTANQTFGCYGAGQAYTILGPNAIESVTFPTGNAIRIGSVLTIRIRLTQPASGGSSSPGNFSLPGEIIKWQVHPSTAFEAEPGTAFDPNATLNQVMFSSGTQQRDLVVRLRQLPGGCTTCTGVAEGRVFDYRDAAPYKRTGNFTMTP